MLTLINQPDRPALLRGNQLRSKTEIAHTSSAPATANRAVLLVEDDKINQLVAIRFLPLLGCKPTVADNGALAVDLVKDGQRFDLMLMDMRMPVMDGIEATWRIRELESQQSLSRTPIIALTANAFQSDIETCRDCGMDDFLSKPMTFEKFNSVFTKWTSGKAGAVREEPGAPSSAPAINAAGNQDGLVVFDEALLEEITGGNIDFVRNLVDHFLQGAKDALSALSTSRPGEKPGEGFGLKLHNRLRGDIGRVNKLLDIFTAITLYSKKVLNRVGMQIGEGEICPIPRLRCKPRPGIPRRCREACADGCGRPWRKRGRPVRPC